MQAGPIILEARGASATPATVSSELEMDMKKLSDQS